MQNLSENSWKNGNNKFLSDNNSFQCKWIKFSKQKKSRVPEWILKMKVNKKPNNNQLCAVYKKLILALRPHIGWKLRESRYSGNGNPKRDQIDFMLKLSQDTKKIIMY